MNEKEIIKFLGREDIAPVNDTVKEMALLDSIIGTCDVYEVWRNHRQELDLDWYEVSGKFERNCRRVYSLYSPSITAELAKTGEVEVNIVNKRMMRSGKRNVVKLGRFLGNAFPFLTDMQKEKIATWYKNRYAPLEADFQTTETDFESVVTLRSARGSYFDTTRRHKNLSDSCMRYGSDYFGTYHHPYKAYESGDFILAYLEKDNRLYARTLIHKASKTHSAIYAVSYPAITRMKEELTKLDVNRVDEEGTDWVGAKLLAIYDYADVEDDYGDRVCHNVILTPYVDFWEHEYGYIKGGYIHLDPELRNNSKVDRVDMQMAEGYNEL